MSRYKYENTARASSQVVGTGIPSDSFAKEYAQVIEEWLPKDKELELLYRGSRDGLNSDEFHSKCNKKGATLTFVKSIDGDIFGGYTPSEWTSIGEYVQDQDTFIFTLKNQHNIPPTKFMRNPLQEYDASILNNELFGPSFGDYDLFLFNYFNEGGVGSNFPTTFVDTTGKRDSLFCRDSKRDRFDNLYTTASEVEVYRVW
eukprot:TRINITY_DN2896_c1_g1_i2.p1 TRINITY_DN2896_c1_g1~~TRINITY_DN2896_c1_g1_i2.p1  ORF type:complete len:201 (+),score=37.88 TRINITY_DN2896_c1_g1_i2:16-618(+)